MKARLSKITDINLGFKFKKIRTKIVVLSLSIFIISQIIVLAIASISSYNNTMMTLDSSLSETASVAAGKITAQLNGVKDLIQQVADSTEISSNLSKDQVILNLKDISKNNKDYYNSISRTDPEGIIYDSGTNVSDREYFQVCKESGKSYVSDPLIHRDTQERVIIIASPIIKNGSFDGVVFASVDELVLSKFVQEIVVGKSGTAYILDKGGTTIAAYDEEIVKNEENVVELAKTDDSLKELAKMEADMAAGNSGFKQTFYDGNYELNAYCPIKDTNGWSLAVTVRKSEFVNSTYQSLFLSLVISLVILAIAAILLRKMALSISKPIIAIHDEMLKFGKGNLSSDFKFKPDTTEIGQLIQSIISTKHNLKAVISDTINCCQEMARGNFNTHPSVEYIGEFDAVETALKQISISLSNTLSEINMASEQVSFGAVQVSSGAQALAQGATEQAATSQELSSSIVTVSDQVVDNAAHATDANNRLTELSREITSSNDKMKHLIQAMSDISKSSNEIEKIIKTIEDIAFQTNILALNAAVEAARAGAAGKGFAVVADEVRNLASKSAEAARNTTDLIENSIHAVKNGTLIADETAKSLYTVVSESNDVKLTVEKIAQASNEQAHSLVQITQGMEQISSVVQSNSATSEESAATAEELSAQAQILKSLVSKFTLLNQEQKEFEQTTSIDFNDNYNESLDFTEYHTPSDLCDKY